LGGGAVHDGTRLFLGRGRKLKKKGGERTGKLRGKGGAPKNGQGQLIFKKEKELPAYGKKAPGSTFECPPTKTKAGTEKKSFPSALKRW